MNRTRQAWIAVGVLIAFTLTSARADETSGVTARRAITHEDLWLMKRVGRPVVSPDGMYAVFAVVDPAYEEREQWSDLWIVPTDGSATPRRITHTRRGESSVAWSPDSRRLAFSAKREDDEVEQIYVIDVVGGGEAQRITQMSAGARAPEWRPDGTALLFTSLVYPGADSEARNRQIAEERKQRKYNARVYDSAPIRHWDRWLDDRKPSLFVQTFEADAQPVNLLAGTRLAEMPGFGGSLEIEGDVIDAAWTPDGTGVVIAVTTNREQWAYAERVHSLWLVPVGSGGEPKRLTTESASYESPAFSRDGRSLYAHMEPTSDYVYNAPRLVRWSWPMSGEPEILTAALDRPIGDFAVAPDGRYVYFLAADAARARLYRVSAGGGDIEQVGALTAGTYTGLTVGGSADTAVVVVNRESASHPAETGRVDVTTGQWQVLTTFNSARTASLDLPPLLEFSFTSRRGRRIHNLLALPPGFEPGGKYPLLVLIHGGPHSMWRDQFVLRWNYHLLAAPGYVVLLTNYTGSIGYGERFAQAIQGDPLAGPAEEINQAADEAIRRYAFIDGSRQAAAGASYGGHLTNWLAATTDRYRALVSHAGLFDLKTQWSTSDVVFSRELNMGGPAWGDITGWREQSPFYRAERIRTPMLVTTGERDYRVPFNNALELWTVLRRQKVPSRLIVFPDENHWILKGENSRFFYAEVRTWLERWLH